tara:strand:+ start:1459 stop:1611 length:153 start_codon:yes stop_codon:yes gene_type:complete
MNIGDSGGCKIKIQCITVCGSGSGVRRFIYFYYQIPQDTGALHMFEEFLQ